MKRIISIFLIVSLCFVLSSCDPGWFEFDLEELTSTVLSVELINYENPDQKDFVTWVLPNDDDLADFDASKVTVIEELDESKIGDFLNELSDAYILASYYAYDSPKNICIRITHDNGDFTILYSNYEESYFGGYVGRYSSDGKVLDFIGSFESLSSFESLVNNYFTNQLPND